MYCKNCGKKLYVASFYCPHCGQKLSQEIETSDKSATQTDVPKQPLISPDASKQLFNQKGKPFWLLLSVVILFVIIITHANFSENSNVSSKEVAEVPSYTFVEPLPEYYEAKELTKHLGESHTLIELLAKCVEILQTFEHGADKGCYYCMAGYGQFALVALPFYYFIHDIPLERLQEADIISKAFSYLEKASNEHIAEAYLTVGEVFIAGLGGIPLTGLGFNEEKKAELFIGFEQNISTGINYLQQAERYGLADSENAESLKTAYRAAMYLSMCYSGKDNIDGFSKDPKEELKYTMQQLDIINAYPEVAGTTQQIEETVADIKKRINSLEEEIRK